MSIITNKKSIVILIIVIMFIMLGTPVFAATTVATSKYGTAKTEFDVKQGDTIKIYIKKNDYSGNIFWFSSNNSYVSIVGGTNSYCSFKGLKEGKTATITIKDANKNKLTSFKINVISDSSNVSNTTLSSNTSTRLTRLFEGMRKVGSLVSKIAEKVKEIDIEETTQKVGTVIQKTSSLLSRLLDKIREEDKSAEPNEPTEPEKEIDLKLNKTSISIDKNGTAQLSATYDGKSVKPSYSSNKTSVATVDSNGKITGKAAGTATITAQYNGKKATCTVTVKETQSASSSDSRTFRFTWYSKEECGTSSTGSGKNDKNFGIDPTLGCYTYNGKVVLAAATNILQKNGGYTRRDHVYYFDYYDEVEFTYNGKKYTGIILDSCGVSMRPEYYYSGTNAKTNVLDMFFPTNAAAQKSGINQKFLTVYY